MATLVCPCISIGTQSSGVPNEQAWTIPAGALTAVGGGAAVAPTFYVSPPPPAPPTQAIATDTQNLLLGFSATGLPLNATISAIRFRLTRMRTALNIPGTGVVDSNARLIDVFTPVGPDLAGGQWPSAYADALYSFTPGTGGVPAYDAFSIGAVQFRIGARGTGGPIAIPFVDEGDVPSAYIDRATMELDYSLPTPVATRPANRGPRRLPPLRH